MSKLLEIDLNLLKNDKKWQENPNYLKIKKITKANLENKTGEIVVGEPLKKVQKKILGFGKYRDKTLDWVETNDPHYLLWCRENIKDFDKKYG